MRRYLRRTLAIARKELLHMFRDPTVMYMALGLPVVMLVIFGFGVSLDVDHVPIAVIDHDRSQASRRLVEAMVAGGAFENKVQLRSEDEVPQLFQRGEVKAALVIPENYERDVARHLPVQAQLLVDGSDGTVASIAMGDAMGIFQTLSDRSTGAALSQGPPIRVRFNPAMRSAFNFVPGVVVMILGMISTLLTALTVAREWERGSMEQLFATPVTRSQIILGKVTPYVALGMLQALLIVTLGSYLFDVPLAGSMPLLFGSSLLFLLGMLGIGLLVSVWTKSQLMAVQFSAMFGFLPSMLLSGFIFPVGNMPFWLQAFASLFPARYYLQALRGLMLKGTGLAILWPNFLILAGFSTLVLIFAVLKFKRRLA